MSFTFPKALRELRIHFSQSGPGSAAVKKFLSESYPALKRANASTPILIREALGVKPVAYARFEKGREETISLDTEDVLSAVKELVDKQ